MFRAASGLRLDARRGSSQVTLGPKLRDLACIPREATAFARGQCLGRLSEFLDRSTHAEEFADTGARGAHDWFGRGLGCL